MRGGGGEEWRRRGRGGVEIEEREGRSGGREGGEEEGEGRSGRREGGEEW